MRFLFLFALAFYLTLGPVCMMHTAYAAESHHDHTMSMHEVSLMSSDCTDCFATHEPTAHDTSCAGNCISVQEPDPLTFAPQTLETPVAMMPSEIVLLEHEAFPLASIEESIASALVPPSQSVVRLL